ncbi:hypothetical protein Q1695_005414 [Nippostrongylus brasiliensis]|nr:hypothetical protein Q1695_005414 [Nippostrongylus brasiliensis]
MVMSVFRITIEDDPRREQRNAYLYQTSLKEHRRRFIQELRIKRIMELKTALMLVAIADFWSSCGAFKAVAPSDDVNDPHVDEGWWTTSWDDWSPRMKRPGAFEKPNMNYEDAVRLCASKGKGSKIAEVDSLRRPSYTAHYPFDAWYKTTFGAKKVRNKCVRTQMANPRGSGGAYASDCNERLNYVICERPP